MIRGFLSSTRLSPNSSDLWDIAQLFQPVGFKMSGPTPAGVLDNPALLPILSPLGDGGAPAVEEEAHFPYSAGLGAGDGGQRVVFCVCTRAVGGSVGLGSLSELKVERTQIFAWGRRGKWQ
jgi:hypothetical protein